MNLENVENYFGKNIKVTYDFFTGTDKYFVIGFDADKEVIIKKPGYPEFTVSSNWFTGKDTQRNIEIIK